MENQGGMYLDREKKKPQKTNQPPQNQQQNPKPKPNTIGAMLPWCFGEIRKGKTGSTNWKK